MTPFAGMLAATVQLFSPHVVDGDTLRQGGTYYRLYGIDAPETDAPGGAAATAALDRLTRGQPLACRMHEIGPYGRAIVTCRRMGGEDVACALVAQGHARDWPEYSGGRYADC